MLTAKIEEDLKSALKSGDVSRTGTLRFVLAQIKNEEIRLKAAGEKMDDESVAVVLRREVKKRKEAADLFTKGGRSDLAGKETMEAEIINAYLPADMDRETIRRTVAAIHGKGITGFSDLMKEAMKELKGKADGKTVSEIVREIQNEK